MRLCRVELDETMLAAAFADDHVIPLSLAAEHFFEAEGRELALPASDDLLSFLPPDGPGFDAARSLATWVDALDPTTRSQLSIPIEQVRLLVPVPRPPKLLLLAGNYAKHVEERGAVAAERAETFPYVFMKPPSTALTHPGDPIVLPAVSPDHIDWECELGVVIGRRCKNVDEADALSHVAGYTVVNDISDREFTPNPGRKPRERDKHFDWLHGKWHDGSCPMGPCILAADATIDPQDFRLRLTVNGEVKQSASAARMVFPVAAVIAFISSFVTLEPGDIISTGTPSGVGSATGTYLRHGDQVEATVEGVGTLSNPVRGESAGNLGGRS